MRSLALAFVLTGAALAADVELEWVTPPDARLEIDGLPFFKENNGEFYRWPSRLKETLPKAVWSLGQSPSGGRIRFRTNSHRIGLKLSYPGAPNMANMHAFGQTGVDLYIDGVYRSTVTANKDTKANEPFEHIYNADPGAGEHEMMLYLPLYKGVKILAVGFEKGSQVKPAAKFAVAKPVVFYGTSITQGGCASRPGMSYQAILARKLNIDFVNLGFSGNGKGEAEVARGVAEIDAAVYVLDYSQNNRTIESLREVYDNFLTVLREKHPKTPIIAITPIMNSNERFSAESHQFPKMREHIREVIAKRVAAGDKNLHLVEGLTLLGPDRLDGLVDGSHPNDLGFQWMADGLAPTLRRVLAMR